MHYKEYTEQAFKIATRHGFHDKQLPVSHWLMLVVTEVSEMVEADRNGRRAQVSMFKRESVTKQPNENKKKHWQFCFETFIKDTVEDEMGDACIRLFDLAGTMGWVLDDLNTDVLNDDFLERFKKKSFTEKAFELCRTLTRSDTPDQLSVELSLGFLRCWAKSEGIDLEWHICQKIEYNGMRPTRHGKKY